MLPTMLPTAEKTIIAEVQRVQATPIENEYGEMRLPKAIRVIFYAPNEKGIDLIVDLFEYDVARAWVAKGKKPAAHLRHAINNRLEHAKFTVEPVQYTSESEYTDQLFIVLLCFLWYTPLTP